MIEAVKGLCCDCIYGDGQCYDYSENETCKRRKEDGSCWEAYNNTERGSNGFGSTGR